jgi:hypothetical protein
VASANLAAGAPGIEQAYDAEGRELCARAVGVVCLLGTPLVLGFAVFDYVVHPQIFPVSVWLRLGSVVVFVLAFSPWRAPSRWRS